MKRTRLLQLLGILATIMALVLPSALRVQAAPTSTNAVVDWNATALTVIAADKQDPAIALRTLTMMHLAIYDAIQAIVSASSNHPYSMNGATLNNVPAGASRESAVASAARTVLLGTDPAQRTTIEVTFATAMAQSAGSTAQ